MAIELRRPLTEFYVQFFDERKSFATVLGNYPSSNPVIVIVTTRRLLLQSLSVGADESEQIPVLSSGEFASAPNVEKSPCSLWQPIAERLSILIAYHLPVSVSARQPLLILASVRVRVCGARV